ncbi:putative peptidase family-domain-containing protein [Apiosordaria backusii]|uniref:Peptidase family-domain-containing protein n=1 Tax=Apiosordaria backusii TaxID=314023 RepID=A0AA40EE83_9PEZI|nr:putative peptidase family-domain-containing protein [Apiosordaria backusii]
MIEIENSDTNINKVEEVHQRSFLISGRCVASSDPPCGTDVEPKQNNFVLVQVTDEHGNSIFSDQRWPLSLGYFKALVLLSPGLNKIVVTSAQDPTSKVELSLRYTPLLQTPPLHLAILVAKDSPLLIDCPPAKFGEISSTHSSLNAAIAKFRVAAYMWQAVAADNLYWEGLGRRSFRIEEEYAPDTLSRHAQQHSFGKQQVMGSVPRIHVIRTEKTVAQLRDAEAELEAAKSKTHQQKRDKDMYKIFSKAVKNSDGPLHPYNKPVVAALVLDAHSDEKLGRTLPSAQFSIHKSEGLSLAMFGSQSTYSWPRFLDEIPECLLDPTPVGSTVSREGIDEPLGMWEVCSISQGRFFREIIRAFEPTEDKLDHRGKSFDRQSLMKSRWGYFQWPQLFLSRMAPCSPDEDENTIRSDVVRCSYYNIKLDKALVLCNSISHFQLPGHVLLSNDVPTIRPVVEDSGDGGAVKKVEITCDAGLARVWVCGKNVSVDSGRTWPGEPQRFVSYTWDEMEEWLGPHVDEEERNATGGVDRIEALAMNGQRCTFRNIASMLKMAVADYIDASLPGTDIRMTKACVDSADGNDSMGGWGINNDWKWTVLFKKRSNRKGTKWDGLLVNAIMIDLRVGNNLDGAIVYYEDGTKVPCGSWRDNGQIQMGGHQARKIAISPEVEVVKVGISRNLNRNYELGGLRIWLSDGCARGALNLQRLGPEDGRDVTFLEPPTNHKIVGFYGTSRAWRRCKKFGILTVPRTVELPESVYDMEQFQNLPLSYYAEKGEIETGPEPDSDIMEEHVEEGPDTGYDEVWDEETLKLYGK